MIKLLGLVLLFAGLISAANAGPLVDNSVNADANAAAAASASASNSNVNAPVTVNTNTAKGGDASARSSADSVNLNTNVNTAKGGAGGSAFQAQGQDQHQRQSMSQSQGQSVDGSGNSHVSINNPRQPVNSALAAALTSSTETCMGSSSIGGQGVGFGISLGTTWENEACERRRNASVLYSFGLKSVAMAIMCQDETVAQAVKSVGGFCPGDELPVAIVQPAPAAVEAPTTPMAPIPN